MLQIGFSRNHLFSKQLLHHAPAFNSNRSELFASQLTFQILQLEDDPICNDAREIGKPLVMVLCLPVVARNAGIHSTVDLAIWVARLFTSVRSQAVPTENCRTLPNPRRLLCALISETRVPIIVSSGWLNQTQGCSAGVRRMRRRLSKDGVPRGRDGLLLVAWCS